MSNELVETLMDAATLMSVESIQDRSDHDMDRVIVVFSNGLEVSVIRGLGSYGGLSDLFEATVYLYGNMTDMLFEDTTGFDNDVRGWLSVSDVNDLLAKAAAWAQPLTEQ